MPSWGRNGNKNSWGGGRGRGHGGHGGRGFGSRNGSSNAQRAGEQEVKLAICKEGFFKAESRFNEDLNDLYRAQGGRFDKEEKAWCMPLVKYKALVDRIKAMPSMVVREIPSFVLRMFEQQTQEPGSTEMMLAEADQILNGKIGSGILHKSMKPFQRIGAATAIKRGGRLLIGDEMGLGKTIQALAVAMYYSSEWPLLVICPSSLTQTWAGQITKWLGIHRDSINVIRGSKQRIGNDPVCILSYDIAGKKDAELKAKYRVLIVDECHLLKSPDAKRTQRISPIIQGCKRAIMLSGTPALSRPCELFTQLNALKPSIFPAMKAFGLRYCNGYLNSFGNKQMWDFTGSSNLSELHLLMSRTVLIRRQKKEVESDIRLPPKVRSLAYIKADKSMMKGIAALQLKQTQLDSKLNSASGSKRAALKRQKESLTMKLFQETASAKIGSALEYLDGFLKTHKGKVLLFGHHERTLDEIMLFLVARKKKFIRIDGSTDSKVRQERCDQFQNDDNVGFAVLSILAAGTGLTLNKANAVIMFEIYWNPGIMLQCEDRAHRIGQENNVGIKYLICRNTYDDNLWKMLQKKLSIVGQSVNGAVDRMALEHKNKPKSGPQAKKAKQDASCKVPQQPGSSIEAFFSKAEVEGAASFKRPNSDLTRHVAGKRPRVDHKSFKSAPISSAAAVIVVDDDASEDDGCHHGGGASSADANDDELQAAIRASKEAFLLDQADAELEAAIEASKLAAIQDQARRDSLPGGWPPPPTGHSTGSTAHIRVAPQHGPCGSGSPRAKDLARGNALSPQGKENALARASVHGRASAALWKQQNSPKKRACPMCGDRILVALYAGHEQRCLQAMAATDFFDM